MFDISFWELVIIAVVALLVIGPDKLPGLARTAGLWIGRARHLIGTVKADIDREIRAEELRQALERDAGMSEIKQILDSTRQDVEQSTRTDYLVKAVDSDDSGTVSGEAAPPAAGAGAVAESAGRAGEEPEATSSAPAETRTGKKHEQSAD